MFRTLLSKKLDISSGILFVSMLDAKNIYPWDIFFLHILAEMGHGNVVCLAKILTVQPVFNYLIRL